MKGRLEAFGTALLAALVLGALAAPGALADGTPEYFHSHDEDIVLLDTEESVTPQVFQYGEGEAAFVCNDLDLEGRLIGTEHLAEESTATFTSDDVTVGLDYTECEFFEVPITLEDDGCHFRIDATTSGEPGHANLELLGCESNGGITITMTFGAVNITLTIPHQLVDAAVGFQNTSATGEGREVRADFTAESVEFVCAPAFWCPLVGFPVTFTSTYEGEVEIAAYEYFGGTTGTYEYGEQVDFWHGPTG